MITEERKTEQFEDDRKKWKIFFDIEPQGTFRGDLNVLVSFVINGKEHHHLTDKNIKNLKQDLRDLGKLRIIKQGEEFLEK